jgi:D-proline reductase (dithiol) PrdB
MARIEQMPEPMRSHIAKLKCEPFDTQPWVEGPPIYWQRVAIVSTAGLHTRGDRPFTFMPGDHYRIIPKDVRANDLVMSHISSNFDRSGFQQDWNVVFPLDRLRELVEKRAISGMANFHYSFMGASDPAQLEASARHVADLMKKDFVNAVLLVPV